MTGGAVTIRQADPHYLDMIALVFERLGVIWETRGEDVFVPARQALTIVPDLGNRIPIIKAQPWPGFPPDLMSIALTVATQSAGAMLFHDWMYESRFFGAGSDGAQRRAVHQQPGHSRGNGDAAGGTGGER
jgi:UDP-N-acetylglucosamine 1-carboxyvinyltransferase